MKTQITPIAIVIPAEQLADARALYPHATVVDAGMGFGSGHGLVTLIINREVTGAAKGGARQLMAGLS